jgi:hypothetical protein
MVSCTSGNCTVAPPPKKKQKSTAHFELNEMRGDEKKISGTVSARISGSPLENRKKDEEIVDRCECGHCRSHLGDEK